MTPEDYIKQLIQNILLKVKANKQSGFRINVDDDSLYLCFYGDHGILKTHRLGLRCLETKYEKGICIFDKNIKIQHPLLSISLTLRVLLDCISQFSGDAGEISMNFFEYKDEHDTCGLDFIHKADRDCMTKVSINFGDFDIHYGDTNVSVDIPAKELKVRFSKT